MQINEDPHCGMIDLGAVSKITMGGEEGDIEIISLMPMAGLSPDDLPHLLKRDTTKVA